MNKNNIINSLISLLFIALVVLFSISIKSLPVLGMLFNPFTGFTQNARYESEPMEQNFAFEGLQGNAEVHFDTSAVPHIFAENDADLYFLQGYVEAKDRLWQIDMQARNGMGELSEIVGEVALDNDKLMRRLGLNKAAATLLEQFKKDGTLATVEQFSKGVNAYISNLDNKNLPLEYKLMNFKPRNHQPIYTAVLMKIMAMRLTAMEADIENTNFVNTYGKELFDKLYPNYYAKESQSPIIPSGTAFKTSSTLDSSSKELIANAMFSQKVLKHLDRHLGSNNWAIHKSKSETNNAILCNDPHLKIHLPAIWYEMHLVSNEQNVYGVSMPGAPGIVIGFNQNIAWGVTNAGRDVRNWYQVDFTDASRTQYRIDSQEMASILRIEKINIKGKGTFIDTVIETQFGPIIYDKKFSQSPMPMDLALSWTNYLASNELKTFLNLNKAKNHEDYLKALESFYCPGQNFIYADVEGNVAIKQQGLFPKTAIDKDKFVLQGQSSMQMMDKFIPIQENPYVLNPQRGFVSSANQHPTDNSYPHYYSSGDFEAYRNRRINEVLSLKDKYSIQDMKNLQGDNFGLMAKEFTPVFLEMLNPTNRQNTIIKELEKWDFFYNEESKMATFFDIWMKNFEEMVWDELKSEKVVYDFPKSIVLYQILKSEPNFVFFDNKSTPAQENAQDIVNQSFEKSIQDYEKNKKAWWEYKDTEIPHLAKIPALGRYHVPTGGNKHIVNATWKDWAPSWRMIVEMKPNRPEAWVCFPGGQSGSPASKFYDNQINTWAKIGYRKVIFSFKPSEIAITKSYYFHKK